MTVVPAYGRDYKSKKDVQAAWDAGKDFLIADMFSGSGYINKSDAPKGTTIMVRYCNKTKVTPIKVV